MTNYEKLVEALRFETDYVAVEKTMRDAAAAIEDLEGFLAEAERDRDEYEERMRKEQERVIELQAEADALAHDIGRYVGINAELTTETEALQAEVKRKQGELDALRVFTDEAQRHIEELQAEVEELKRVNMELFEDLPKYGDKILHWVSVEERLPKKNGAYLVFMGYGHNWIWFKDIFMDGKFMADTCALNVAKVTHWMPIEPPQEVQE